MRRWFICFQSTQPITQSTLAANSTLSYTFSVDLSGFVPAAAADYQDDFKISWDGDKSKSYDGSDTTTSPRIWH